MILQGFRSSDTHTLTVKITHLQNENGSVEVSLYEKGNHFPCPGKHFKKVRVNIKGNVATCQFSGLKNGDYAIAMYHDENGDKKCNKNMFGVPTEGYAFSNDARPFLSPPKFKSCLFWVTENRTIKIKMVY